MALYLKEVALLETTTNTLVKLTNVMEGVENGAVFGYQTELISIKVNANQTEQVVTRHTFDIVVKDDATPATQAILTAWANNPELRFKASGYSGDTFFLWDEAVPIVFSRQYDLIGARHLIMTLDAVSGYNGASGSKKLPVYAGQNLLGIYNVLAGSSVLNGFNDNGLVSDGVTGANQTIEIDSDPLTSYLYSNSLFFPFPSAILTFSCTVVTAPDDFFIGSANFTDAGVLIAQDYSVLAGGVGRLSYTYVSNSFASNTAFIRIGFTGTASTTFVFNTPCIRLGAGESTFVM
jgi:hypothetical protein